MIIPTSDTTREPRIGEINASKLEGGTYYFIDEDTFNKRKKNKEYFHSINFGNTNYGYLNSEFSKIKDLIVVSGSSGAGKDMVIENFVDDNDKFKSAATGALIALPDLEYYNKLKKLVQSRNGKMIIFSLFVEEEVKFQRIFENSKIYKNFKEKIMDINSTIEEMDKIFEDLRNERINISNRLLRDNDFFENGLQELKKNGFDIIEINTTKMSKQDVMNYIYSILLKEKFIKEKNIKKSKIKKQSLN